MSHTASALSADAFRDAILSVTEDMRTVQSSLAHKKCRALSALVLSTNALTAAKLARKNDRLAVRRVDVVRQADRLIAEARERMRRAGIAA